MQRLRAGSRTPGVIDLNEGVIGPELFPRDALERALHALTVPPELGYPDPLGEPHLCEVIADDQRRHHGARPDPDTILITGGGQQAVYLIVRALLRPGDAIGIEQPSYYYSLPLFQSAGIRLLSLPVDEAGLDPEALRPAFERGRLRLVLLTPSYQNPTTTTTSLARRERLLATCRDLNLPLVEDDGYSRLWLDAPPPPALRTLDREGRVIQLGTLSKTIAPGLRVGWVVGPKPVIDRLADVRGQIDFGMGAPAQWLVADFLASDAWPAHLTALRAALRARRDAFAARLAAEFGSTMRFALPPGGLHLWVRWDQPSDDRRRLDAAVAAGVTFAPGRLYGAPDGFLRLSYARAREAEAAEGIRRLATVVSSQ